MTARGPLRRALLAAALAALGACAPARPGLPAPVVLPEPSPAEVERVLFLLGDPGEVVTESSPVLQRLTADVEGWAGILTADSAVAVVVLGDIVYPAGLHGPESPLHERDRAVVLSQIRVVGGPVAARRGARLLFVAGNHDWGLRDDYEGARRLVRLRDLADSVSAADGVTAMLVPEPGSGGPHVWDWGPHVRLLLLDTAWWLLGRDDQNEVPFFRRIEEAMAAAGERKVLFAAHHPLRTAGPHGGGGSIWKMMGAYFVLQRAGVFLQDLSSGPYRRLDRRLRRVFERTGPPFAFIGGHEHSLQLFGRVEPTDPDWGIVSGSGSKVSGVVGAEGLRFAAGVPGYMRLLVLRDGSMHLSVEATEAEFLKCEDPETAAECIAAGLAAFRTVHSQPLR